MGTVCEISAETQFTIIVLGNVGQSEFVTASQLKLSKTCFHQTIIQHKETGSN